MTLESALTAYGLGHLWPAMEQEEMDVDAFCMLEGFEDLEELQISPADQPATLDLIATLRIARGM
jgi:hypothetical protein